MIFTGENEFYYKLIMRLYTFNQRRLLNSALHSGPLSLVTTLRPSLIAFTISYLNVLTNSGQIMAEQTKNRGSGFGSCFHTFTTLLNFVAIATFLVYHFGFEECCTGHKVCFIFLFVSILTTFCMYYVK